VNLTPSAVAAHVTHVRRALGNTTDSSGGLWGPSFMTITTDDPNRALWEGLARGETPAWGP